jgi:hypothetical protein
LLEPHLFASEVIRMRTLVTAFARLVPPMPSALAFAAVLFSASAGGAAEPTQPVTTYWHDWADSKGVSHLTRCELSSFVLESMAPPADPEWINRQAPGNATALTIVQPPQWKGIWHKETTVLWVVTLDGTWFVEAMDGTRVDLSAGDVFLAEDRDTKPDAEARVGHRSGNTGDGPVTLMVVQLDQPPTSDQPCRFK